MENYHMMILSGFRLAKVVLLLTIALTGCATFRVDSPKPSDPLAAVNGWSRVQDHIVITVVFNTAVNPGTVVLGNTLFFVTSKDPNATGSIGWAADNKSFTFTSTKVWGDLLSPRPDDFFTLKLVGTDAGHGKIVDTANTALDGDYDGNPGGDYSMTFTLIG